MRIAGFPTVLMAVTPPCMRPMLARAQDSVSLFQRQRTASLKSNMVTARLVLGVVPAPVFADRGVADMRASTHCRAQQMYRLHSAHIACRNSNCRNSRFTPPRKNASHLRCVCIHTYTHTHIHTHMTTTHHHLLAAHSATHIHAYTHTYDHHTSPLVARTFHAHTAT